MSGDPAPATVYDALQWQPGPGAGHVESLFLKLNLPERGVALWLQFGARRLLPSAGVADHGHVMAAFFRPHGPGGHVAVKQRFTPEEIVASPGRLAVHIGENLLEQGFTRGSVAKDGHRVAWELSYEPSALPLFHLPWPFLYRAPLPKTKAVTPALSARFSGRFEVDGEEIEVAGAPGMHGHNWGTQHAHRWIWAHGNAFAGERPEAATAVVECLAAQVKIGRLTTPWLNILNLRYGPHRLALNSLREPWAVKTRPAGNRWHVQGSSGALRVKGSFEAPPAHFLCAQYLNPDGTVVYCRNATVGSAVLALEQRSRGGWRPLDTLRSTETTALEIAGPDPPADVPVSVR